MLDKILLEYFDMVSFLETHGYKVKRIGGKTGFITTCPYCGKAEHFGFNPSSKTFGCYKCRISGTFFNLIRKILRLDYVEAIEYLKGNVNVASININYLDSVLEELKIHSAVQKQLKPIQLPKEYISLANKRVPYLDKRNISNEQVCYYKIGICYEGPYKNRLIVCDVDDQQIPIYWIARDITGKVAKKDKVWNPNAEVTGVGSADILFNFFLAKNYKTVILTEGVFDSIYVGNNGVCSYGVGLKKSHTYWLLQGGFEEVVIMYDSDVPYDQLKDIGIHLLQFGFKVKICQLPNGDPDNYPKPVLYKMIDDTPYFTGSKIDTLDVLINDR